MLRQEAEQACDDLVVWSTGRSEDYARGLTSVAELAHLKTHLKRRIPVMNVFAAAESDLSLRIRRALDGGVRRMGVWSRVLAAVLLFGTAIVTLPSCGTNDNRTGVDSTGAMEESPEALKVAGEEATRDAAVSDLDAIAARIRAAIERGEMTPEEGREKMAVVRERLAAEEEKERDGVDWEAAMATSPEKWSAELKAQIVAAGYDLEEVAEGIRQRQEYEAKRDEKKKSDGVDWETAKSTPPEQWSAELEAQIVAAGYDLEEIAEEVRQHLQDVSGRTRK